RSFRSCYRFTELGGRKVCWWLGGHAIDRCWELAGETGTTCCGKRLKDLWLMANGRRESLRRHAFDIATLNNLDSKEKKRLDFDKFFQTGDFSEPEKA